MSSLTAPAATWNGGSGLNDFWSTGGAGGNWSGAAAPGASDDALFGNTDAQANSTTINNIVDANRTVRAIRYTNNGASLWQNTQINTGVTLTASGTDSARTFGLGSAVGGTQVTQATISGDGTLLISRSGGVVRIGETNAASSSGTLDMSGLATFTANLGTTGTFRIGAAGGSAANADWLVKLAQTSTITTDLLDVGSITSNPGVNSLRLGAGQQTINANTISVGMDPTSTGRGSGEILFNSSAGTLKIRAANDIVDGRANLNVANATHNGTSGPTGLFDVTGHSADLKLNTLAIGNRVLTSFNSNPAATTGVFSFDTGTLDVTTINLGKRQNVNNANGVAGTLNIGGGTAIIGDISMAQNAGTIGAGVATATLNFTGGVITINGNITQVSSTQAVGTLNLNGAVLDMTGGNIGGGVAVTNVYLRSGTLQNVAQINNGGAIAKTTSGTLIFAGTSAYTGTTDVDAGKLLINGAKTGGGTITVKNNATLGGVGTIAGNTTIQSGGTLSPGNSPGTITFTDNLTIAPGAIYAFESGDLTIVLGQLALGNSSLANWTLQIGPGFQDGGSIVLFDYGTLAANFDLTPTFDLSGMGFTPSGPLTLVNDTANQQILLFGVQAPIPEPGTLLLAALGLVGLAWRLRGRRRLPA